MLARKDDDAAASGYEGGVEIVLDQTAEFCRGLGEVDKIKKDLFSNKMQLNLYSSGWTLARYALWSEWRDCGQRTSGL